MVRRYYVNTAGKNDIRIAGYIKQQLDEDKLGEQLTMMKKEITLLRVVSNRPV